MKNNTNRTYLAIDLKSFYASVECVERGLNPLTTNLVVADSSRTEKTVCLAITPSLKAYGLGGRSRLYEVVQKVRNVNAGRKYNNHNKEFTGSSYDAIELQRNKNLKLDYITAVPRMGYYMKYSNNILNIYLKYFSKEDIYVYSVDEVFCDATNYLKTYNLTPRELITKIIQEVFDTTGITATGGIGTNLYLAKVAMDIVAKHTTADKNGVRIAEIDEISYRKLLWNHRPLTDFWRVGKGYAKKLEEKRLFTMGDIARCSIKNEDMLFRMFGINAELLIDHAWGYEPCTLKSIMEYKPTTNSLSSGQVLHCPYNYEQTKLIVKEMTELLTLDLVEKHLVTKQLVLTIGYDKENVRSGYIGEIKIDHYGRKIPKHAHGTINLDHYTASTKTIIEKVMELYERIIDKELTTRRVNITACNVLNENKSKTNSYEQMNFFTDYKKEEEKKNNEKKEKELQKAVIGIKNKFGKNAIIKGMNLQNGGTTIERNGQIGGHRE